MISALCPGSEGAAEMGDMGSGETGLGKVIRASEVSLEGNTEDENQRLASSENQGLASSESIPSPISEESVESSRDHEARLQASFKALLQTLQRQHAVAMAKQMQLEMATAHTETLIDAVQRKKEKIVTAEQTALFLERRAQEQLTQECLREVDEKVASSNPSLCHREGSLRQETEIVSSDKAAILSSEKNLASVAGRASETCVSGYEQLDDLLDAKTMRTVRAVAKATSNYIRI